jgi:hypothetical protein
MWSFILLLNTRTWSRFNTPLPLALTVFLLLSICVSLVLGSFSRRQFRFERLEILPKRRSSITIMLVLLYLLDFAYSGSVPLWSFVVEKSATYSAADFATIPGVHALLVPFGLFYAVYLFYLLLCFPKKRSLRIEFSVIVGVQVLQFSRGSLVALALACVLLGAASARSLAASRNHAQTLDAGGEIILADTPDDGTPPVRLRTRRKTLRTVVVSAVAVVAVLFLFGVAGSLREGSSWSDISDIETMGRFTEYPAWLPPQFMWAFAYLTTPLFNLANNIEHGLLSPAQFFASSFVPDIVSKRFFPTLVTSRSDYILDAPYFNAGTGFIAPAYNGGMLGLYIAFSVLVVLCLTIQGLARANSVNAAYRAVIHSLLCVSAGLFFFYNTLTNTAISLALIYPLIGAFLRFAFNRRSSA